MNFNFGEVLTRAWQITWKYKALWIFGILAGSTQAAEAEVVHPMARQILICRLN